MKYFLFITMIILCAASSQAADVGVSVSVGQPGFYGRIDIGNYPQPEIIYERPIVVRPAPVGVVYQPIYVHVPPGHEKKWSKHCSKYNACGRPVYFVHDRWYNEIYVPQYQARHGKGHGEKHGHGNDQGENHGGNQDKGHKNGNHGHDKGHD
jgi:hypothetical protein